MKRWIFLLKWDNCYKTKAILYNSKISLQLFWKIVTMLVLWMLCVFTSQVLDPPGVRLTLLINQWPDNPQLFTNPHWLSVHNVYCLPVIGMNNISTQKNNMLLLWFFCCSRTECSIEQLVRIFFFYDAYQKF